MGEYEAERDFAVSLVHTLGNMQKSAFGKGTKSFEKSTRLIPDAVGNPAKRTALCDTDIDCQVEALRRLYERFPDNYVLVEEQTDSLDKFEKNKESPRCWVMDCLDGSWPFIQEEPFFGVAIGLMENKEFVLAVTYMPLLRKVLHVAVKGQGAFRYTNSDNAGTPVKLSEPQKPEAGDIILLGGGVSNSVTTGLDKIVIGDMERGVSFKYEEKTSTICRVSRVLDEKDSAVKAYLVSQSGIFAVGPSSLIVQEAGGVFIDLKKTSPKWVKKPDSDGNALNLESYAVLGPKQYCQKLIDRVNTVISFSDASLT